MADSPGRKRIRPAVLAAALSLACAPPAPAVDFFVNSYAEDAHDFAIDGVCDATSGSHVCTLRAAVEEAEATGADDLIYLGTGTTTLDLGFLPSHQSSHGTLGIVGNGPDLSAIVGDPSGENWLIMTSGAVGLFGLRVAGFSSEFQSAVVVEADAYLFVGNTVFEQNRAEFGAASKS